MKKILLKNSKWEIFFYPPLKIKRVPLCSKKPYFSRPKIVFAKACFGREK